LFPFDKETFVCHAQTLENNDNSWQIPKTFCEVQNKPILNNFFTFSCLLEKIVYLKCKKVSLSCFVTCFIIILFWEQMLPFDELSHLKILVWICNKFIYQIITCFHCCIKISIIIIIVENVLIVFMINYSVIVKIHIDWEEFPDTCFTFLWEYYYYFYLSHVT